MLHRVINVQSKQNHNTTNTCTLRGHLQTEICTPNVIVMVRGWGVVHVTLNIEKEGSTS